MKPLSPSPVMSLAEALSPFRPLFAAIPGAVFGVWLLMVGAPGWCVFTGASVVTLGLGYGSPK